MVSQWLVVFQSEFGTQLKELGRISLDMSPGPNGLFAGLTSISTELPVSTPPLDLHSITLPAQSPLLSFNQFASLACL